MDERTAAVAAESVHGRIHGVADFAGHGEGGYLHWVARSFDDR